MALVYVYALLAGPLSGSRAGGASRTVLVGRRRIHLIQAGAIVAAVERIARAPRVSETALRAQHELVVALGRRFEALLPVRFGAALERAELERLLAARQTRLLRALEDVRDREQMTVRIITAHGRAVVPAARAPTGTAYLTARRTALASGVPPAGKRLRRAVRPLVDAERVDPARGRVRATLHHLIPRGRAAEYRALVERSLATTPPGGDQVVVSGPWPPFAFTPELWP